MAPKKQPASKKPTARSVVKKAAKFDEYAETDAHSVNDQTAIELSTPKSAMQAYSNNPMIDADDVFIPRLRLAQGLTSEVQDGMAKPGQWLVTGEDAMNTVTVIPTKFVRRRELRETGDNRVVLCRSNDSITGMGTPGGDCATCPLSKWEQGKGKNSKNKAPACTFIYSYIVYVVETKSVAILEFYRTSIPAGKMLNTMIMQRGLGTFAAKLSSNSSKGPAGTYYSPVVSGGKSTESMIKEAQKNIQEMFGS